MNKENLIVVLGGRGQRRHVTRACWEGGQLAQRLLAESRHVSCISLDVSGVLLRHL